MDRQIEFIEKQILAEQAAKHCPFHNSHINVKNLKWTGSMVEWVELIYALHFSGLINNGKITLKSLFRYMGEVFDIEAKEFSRTFMDIKNRTKGDRTQLLDVLKRGLIRRMEEADRKPPRK